MEKTTKIFAVLVSIVLVVGNAWAIIEPGYLYTGLHFTKYEGLQSDITRQTVAVFNDLATYGEYLSAFSSLEGDIPTFDEDSETLIAITTKANPCSHQIYARFVDRRTRKSVVNDEGNLVVTMYKDDPSIDYAQLCESSDSEMFLYHFVVTEKTNLPVSVKIINGL